jgi:diguanylate cyclase (GGDEF)-like protein/PAS domain S-box-containing protein
MQLLNPNMRQQFRDEIIPALRTYDNWQGETWTQRLDGTYWLSFSSIIALRDEHGEVCHIATIFRDVTEQRNTEEQLQLTRFALDHAPDGVAFLNSEGQHLYANHMLCHKLGYEQDELMKLRVMDIDPALSLLMWQYMWESVKHHGANVFEGMHYCKDGTNFPVEIAFAYLEFRGSAYLCSFARDISERKAYEQQITRLAFVDPLTGLANRRRLYDAGDKAVAEARTPGSVALLYLDLDRFKAFNDTLGHDAGDELLVQVTERLQQGSRSIGMLSRIGGDEFAVLLTNTNTEQALDYARHILNQLHQPFELRGHQVYLGGSIGIAFGPLVGQPFSVLLTHADIAMYSAKRSGTGVQVYDPAISPLSPEWLQLEADLRHALQHNGLMLHYQPIMDIKLQRLLAVEALVRWPHPQRGMLSPGIFLPLAEEVGMLATLDAWVLRAALSQVAAWQALGQSITVTVNLTAPSLQKADLVEHVGYLLDLLNVPAERLVIELTEHTALRDLSLTDQVMRGLQALGVRIALDDFGTGYASLTHLRDLPIDMLKVERAFAAGIGSNTKDEAVLRAVLALGHGLEMTVIAEGIEETVQLGWLRDAGCRHVQGFLLGRPVPPEHFSNGYQLPYLPLR